ncbi:hypothetical protein Daus18300_000146 [Diaporthe australafricana]|uniref:RTA1 domain-containing protein n=1 Tax=Diaporthe australafricana TaxID=127596 RepID=A0ABR3Y8E3_9PEZI
MFDPLQSMLLVRQESSTTTEAQQQGGGFKLYHYDPTVAGAVLFTLLFIGTTAFHCLQLYRSRCWFVFPILIGGIFEFLGYAARAVSGRESPDWTLGPYIAQSLLLLVAPALFAATIYMELGRVISLTGGDSYCLIRKKWLTKLFVCGDVLSFFLQGGGGGYQASGTLEALDLGSRIITVGLFVQLAFFGLFIVAAVHFNIKINRMPTVQSSSSIPWEKHMKALYVASVLIMVRSIFRVAEYLQGFDGYILRHEMYLYIFDAALMFFVMVLFNVIYPGEIASLMQSSKVMDDAFSMGRIPHRRLGSDLGSYA